MGQFISANVTVGSRTYYCYCNGGCSSSGNWTCWDVDALVASGASTQGSFRAIVAGVGVASSASGFSPGSGGTREVIACGAGLYPNGNNCYPCLGCHPCGNS